MSTDIDINTSEGNNTCEFLPLKSNFVHPYRSNRNRLTGSKTTWKDAHLNLSDRTYIFEPVLRIDRHCGEFLAVVGTHLVLEKNPVREFP